MYPETDLPLLKISRQVIDQSKKNIPEEEREIKIPGLNEHMISLLFKNNKLEEFKELMHIIKKPQLIAKTLLIFPKEIASKAGKSSKEIEKILNRDVLGNVLEDVVKNKIQESEIKNALERIVNGEDVEQEKADESEVEERIIKIIKEKPGLSANAYMGLVMKEFKGKISGQQAIEMIKKHVKQEGKS